MSTTATDRTGRIGDVGVKAPCAAATTAAITLSGAQTIDGVAVTTGDRVLVKNQANPVDNGIYDADTGDWSRSTDCDGNYDLAVGTLIKVNGGTVAQGFWYANGTDPLVVGTSSISFVQASTVLAVVSAFMQTMLDDADAATARATLAALASDLTTLTALSGAAATGDLLALYDVSASAIRKVTFQTLLNNIIVIPTNPGPAIDDSVLLYDLSGTAATTMTLANLVAVVNGLTEDTTPDVAADFLLSYDSSAGVAKKVKPSNLSPFSKSFTSSDQTITAAGALTIAHSLGAVPSFVQAYLVCQTGELGYTAGDVLVCPLTMDMSATSSRGVSCVVDATNLNIRFGSSAASIGVLNKGTGNATSITDGNWKIRFKAWA